jgi:hypothetical protein
MPFDAFGRAGSQKYLVYCSSGQLLLFSWACSLFAVLGASICGFSFMPMFLAVGIVAEGVFFFFLVLCITAGDILLDFALEDERFFELAMRCHALSHLRRYGILSN